MKNMHIAFSPPDITEEEIAEVVDTLRSGWITTGPKTKLFEKKLSEYMETNQGGLSEFSNSLPGDDTASSGNWTGR